MLTLTALEKLELRANYDDSCEGLGHLIWVIRAYGKVDSLERFDGDSDTSSESSDEDEYEEEVVEPVEPLRRGFPPPAEPEAPEYKKHVGDGRRKRDRSIASIPVWKRPPRNTPQAFDARNRPNAKLGVKQRITKEDALRTEVKPPPPFFQPKPLLLKVFAITHGIRPKVGRSLVKNINRYLATPGATVMTAQEVKGRFRQVLGSNFPLRPFTIVYGAGQGFSLEGMLWLMQFCMANTYQLGILLWLLFVAFYYTAVNVAAVAVGEAAAISYNSVSSMVLLVALLYMVVLSWQHMSTSGPPPLLLLDLAPVMKVLCLFIVFDLVIRSRIPIIETGGIKQTYDALAVIFHISTLLILAYFVVLGSWRASQQFANLRALYVQAFWIGWLGACTGFGAVLSFNGDSFSLTRALMFTCIVGLQSLLWYLPALSPFSDRLSGAVAMILLSVALVDVPLLILYFLNILSPIIVVDIVVKLLRILHVALVMQATVSELYRRRFPDKASPRGCCGTWRVIICPCIKAPQLPTLLSKQRKDQGKPQLSVAERKSLHFVASALQRRLARRGSSFGSGDTLSESDHWSDEDERRATLRPSIEEYTECVLKNAGAGRDTHPPVAPAILSGEIQVAGSHAAAPSESKAEVPAVDESDDDDDSVVSLPAVEELEMHSAAESEVGLGEPSPAEGSRGYAGFDDSPETCGAILEYLFPGYLQHPTPLDAHLVAEAASFQQFQRNLLE